MAYDPTPQVPPSQGYPAQQPPAPTGGPSFDVGTFWKGLGMQGQIVGIASLVLLLSLFLPWFSYSESIKCNGLPGCTSFSTGFSVNAWSTANGGGLAGLGFGFTLVWLVILAAFVLIGLQVVGALRKLSAQQGQLFILMTAGVALLCELIYLVSAFGAGSSASFFNVSVSVGPGFGFWVGLLATLAIGGAYGYFTYLKKSSAGGVPM